jgi:hypothetical protein
LAALVASVVTASLGIIGAQPTRAAGTGDFVQPATSPEAVGAEPLSAAVGRFNGDASDDLAVGNYLSDNVTILLGSGAGDFTAAATSPEAVGDGPLSVVVGRFNADAFDDLAVTNQNDGTVTILLGDGAGDFTPAATSPETVGTHPNGAAVGRLNADAFDDLAVANQTDGTVTILLGDGTGNFTAPATSPESVGTSPTSVSVGRFNGDAFSDLAVTNVGSDDVTILLGDGSGNFTAPATSPEPVGDGPWSAAVGRFNIDAFDDLAVGNQNSDDVTILLGDGTGNFTQAPTSPEAVGNYPQSVVVGLFNNDPLADLATANAQSNDVTILFGHGTGDFTQAPTSPESAGTTPVPTVVGRFNGDDASDLAVANYASNDVTILLNTPAPAPPGGAAPPSGPPAPPAPPADATAPETTITSAELVKTRDRTPTFTFISTEPGSTFECSVDGSDFVGCGTPFTTVALKRREVHTFAVRAIDLAGNVDPTPAEDEFKVKRRRHHRQR